MLEVVRHGNVYYVYHRDTKRWWSKYFESHGRAAGCIANLEQDWQAADGNRQRDLECNFVESRKEVIQACSR